jgi:hypothetical protein
MPYVRSFMLAVLLTFSAAPGTGAQSTDLRYWVEARPGLGLVAIGGADYYGPTTLFTATLEGSARLSSRTSLRLAGDFAWDLSHAAYGCNVGAQGQSGCTKQPIGSIAGVAAAFAVSSPSSSRPPQYSVSFGAGAYRVGRTSPKTSLGFRAECEGVIGGRDPTSEFIMNAGILFLPAGQGTALIAVHLALGARMW